MLPIKLEFQVQIKNIQIRNLEQQTLIIDCQLLKEIYINLLDQKEPKLNLESGDIPDLKLNNKLDKVKNIKGKIIKISDEELESHKNFLKTSLQRNFFK